MDTINNNGLYARKCIYKHKKLLYENVAAFFKKIKKIENFGIQFNRDDVIFVAKAKEGKLVWLEKGNDSAGLKHIVKEHGKQFVDADISIDKTPQILIETLNIGEYVGIQGKDRKVYKVDIEGSNIFIAISIIDNGFIVGANITTK